MADCSACGKEVLEIDVRCPACGAVNGATGAHRMLGQVMLGQYELVDVLGQGGMSVVFKGRHKLTEQDVALKILPPELAAHSQVKSRFLEEAPPEVLAFGLQRDRRHLDRLEGDDAAEERVLGLVDHGGQPTADLVDQLISPDLLLW